MRPSRIGFFTEIYRPVVNGVVESVDALAGGLDVLGHEVYCFAPHMPGSAHRERVVRLPSLPLPSTPYRLIVPMVTRRDVRDLIRSLSIVHVHSLFVTGWTGLRFARRNGVPIVLTYHTHLEEYAHYVPFEPNTTRFAATQLTRTFANLVDAVIVPTQAVADRLRDNGVERRIEVIPTGIDVERFAGGTRSAVARARLGATRDAMTVFLIVTRLAREKNINLVLEAFARLNDPRSVLAVVGDGPERDELIALSLSLDIADRVRFTGAVPRAELPALYASADAFVFASTTETQGLVLAEARASGLPIVAADTSINRDSAGDDATLVNPEPAAFAAAMRALLDARRARVAHPMDATRFSIASQAGRVEALYAELLDESNVCSV